MHRIFGLLTIALLGLLLLVPVAMAADPLYEDGRVVVAVGGDVVFPAGERADTMVVVDGSATVEGDVRTLIVVSGSATLVGATVDDIVAVQGDISLDPATIVTGDIRTIESTLARAAGATVGGEIVNGIDVIRAAMFLGPFLFLTYVGFLVAALVGALLLTAVASRQVRAAEELIAREPATVIVAGIGGILAIATFAVLAMVTIIGIPLGFLVLVGFLPALAFVGYLVTAIWIGRLLLGQRSGSQAADHPYVAAALGVGVMGVLSLVPFVGGLVGLMGMGAVVLLMWRTIRGATGPVAASTEPAPVAAAG